MNAADTNVYIYALDADEPVKQAKALELFDRLVLQAADTVLFRSLSTLVSACRIGIACCWPLARKRV